MEAGPARHLTAVVSSKGSAPTGSRQCSQVLDAYLFLSEIVRVPENCMGAETAAAKTGAAGDLATAANAVSRSIAATRQVGQTVHAARLRPQKTTPIAVCCIGKTDDLFSIVNGECLTIGSAGKSTQVLHRPQNPRVVRPTQKETMGGVKRAVGKTGDVTPVIHSHGFADGAARKGTQVVDLAVNPQHRMFIEPLAVIRIPSDVPGSIDRLGDTEVARWGDRAQIAQPVTFAPEKSMSVRIGEACIARYKTTVANRLGLTDGASRKCSQISDVVGLRRCQWREN